MTEIERVWSARRNRYQGDVGVKYRERENCQKPVLKTCTTTCFSVQYFTVKLGPLMAEQNIILISKSGRWCLSSSYKNQRRICAKPLVEHFL